MVCEERFVDGLISIFNEKIVKGKVKKKWKFKVRGRGSRVPLTYSEKMIFLKTIWNHSLTMKTFP